MPIPLPIWENDDNPINSLPWTAPEDCLVIATIEAAGAGKILYVNGCRAAQSNVRSSGSSSAVTASIFMRKGDVLTQNDTGTIGYAYWHKLGYTPN